MRTVPDFIFLGSKITVDGDCSHAIKTRLLLGRKAMTNLNSVLKSRDITLPTKVYVLKAMVFSVWMWELDHKEGWTPNNWCFLNCDVEKTLENLLYSKRSKQSILKEINPEYSLEGLLLKLKLQYFGHLMGRVNSLEKKKTWCWERLKVKGEGAAEDGMVFRYHRQLNRHEFE